MGTPIHFKFFNPEWLLSKGNTWTKNGGATSYHTGIVIENDGVKVYTIEGNTGYSSGATNWSNSWVSKVSNSLSFANIYGYWEM